MKADIVAVLKSSQYAFVRELVGGDPVAVFRWAILRAFIRAYFAFLDSGKRHRGEFLTFFLKIVSFFFIYLIHFLLDIHASGQDSLTGKGKGDSNRKNRVSKTRSRPKNWRNLETVRTLAGRLGHSSSSLTSSSVAASSASSSHEKLAVTASGSTATLSSAVSHQSVRGESLLVVHKNVKKATTVGAQFQHSLQSLMVALNNANPFFVRCIKSNRLKVHFHFFD